MKTKNRKPRAPRTISLIEADMQGRDRKGHPIQHELAYSKDGQFWLIRPGSREKISKRKALRTFFELLSEDGGSSYAGDLTPLIRAV